MLDLQRAVGERRLAEQPAIVSVLVGINDTWRRYDSGDPTTAEQFEHDYRAMLAAASPNARLVLIEPFLLPVNDEQLTWRDDLDAKIAVTRSLAAEFGAVLIPADAALRAVGPAAEVAPDGIHPSERGHQELARLWLDDAKTVLDAVVQELGVSRGGGAAH